MHDAAHKYEADTIVVDIEEQSMPSIGRVTTEDLVAHVLVMGQRHRRTPDLKETSCGVPLHSQFYPPLREKLTNLDTPSGLCNACFTPHEMLRAMQADADALDADDQAKKKRDAASDVRKSKRWITTTEGDSDE